MVKMTAKQISKKRFILSQQLSHWVNQANTLKQTLSFPSGEPGESLADLQFVFCKAEEARIRLELKKLETRSRRWNSRGFKTRGRV